MIAVESRSNPALLARLRARIERIGAGATSGRPASNVVPLGVDAVDAALPGGGFPRAGLHEIVAADRAAAAAGFAAVLLARLAGAEGSVVWCRRGGGSGRPYGPGLEGFGIDLGRLLVVDARRDTDVLWAMEESLRSGAVEAVLGETDAAAPIALRRLQLAAETGRAGGLLLRRCGAPAAAGPATSRWRIAAAPGDRERDVARWRVELLRCKAAVPADWLLEWSHATHRLAVAAAVRDRPAAPRAGDGDLRRAG